MRYNTRWEDDGECYKDSSDFGSPGGPARLLIPRLRLSSWPGEWRPCRLSPGDDIIFTHIIFAAHNSWAWPDVLILGTESRAGWRICLTWPRAGRVTGAGPTLTRRDTGWGSHRIMIWWPWLCDPRSSWSLGDGTGSAGGWTPQRYLKIMTQVSESLSFY